MNIVVPIASSRNFLSENDEFPKHLIEVGGKLLVELALKPLLELDGPKQFIFIVKASDCRKFHLDSVLKLLTNDQSVIIEIENETQGAVCSVLLAIDYINNSDELIISNSDHTFQISLNPLIEYFRSEKMDAGIPIFESVHPHWSFVSLDVNNRVQQATEKRPISRNAVAGIYYFKNGSDFIYGSIEMIRNDDRINNLFYLAPALNQLILHNKHVGVKKIKNESYFNFYSQEKIKEYEKNLVDNI